MAASGGMFRSLRVRNYRLYASGQAVSLTGTWMQRVAQDWLVLELSDNSGTALGIVLALQFGPSLLFSLWGGVLADRYDKRTILLCTQSSMIVLAALLGLLDVTGAVQLWHVYLLAALLGVASALDVPARQSFVVEMVGSADLANAVSLNSATFNSARIVGPALAGVIIAATDTGWVFLGNALLTGAVIAGLLLMRPSELHRSKPTGRSPGQLADGLRYVRSRPDLVLPMALVFVVGTFGLNFPVTMALLAREVFDKGAAAYGLLSTAIAVGSLAGALASTRRTSRPTTRFLLGATFAFGVLEALVGVMPTYETVVVLLVPTGLAALSFTIAANSSVQLGSDPAYRGRVMALYLMCFMGGTPLGAPLIGVLSDAFGPRAGVSAGGGVCAVAAVVAAAVLARRSARSVRSVRSVRSAGPAEPAATGPSGTGSSGPAPSGPDLAAAGPGSAPASPGPVAAGPGPVPAGPGPAPARPGPAGSVPDGAADDPLSAHRPRPRLPGRVARRPGARTGAGSGGGRRGLVSRLRR